MTGSDPKSWVDDYDREHNTGPYKADDPVLGVLTGRYPSRTMPIAMDAECPCGVTGQHFCDETEDNSGEQDPSA